MIHDQTMDYRWWLSSWDPLSESEQKKLNTAHDIYEETRFPAHLLPTVVRDVVVALARDVDAPIELISGTVLSAVSLACQGFIEVQFPDGRKKPCSLYNLILADSGERKSTIHSLVMKPFLDFERKDKIVWEKASANYNADMLIWNTQNKIILKEVSRKIDKGESYNEERRSLARLSTQKPRPPKKMKLIYTDTTPEAMQRGLYDNIPSAGYISAEASVFFEGRAKNNLGFLNELWDGASIDVERRSKESFSVVNARFSMLLLVQNDIFIQYFKKYGRRATGSGFLSRFLISAVPGGQFRRLSTSYSVNSQELAIFHERINELLTRIEGEYKYKQQEERDIEDYSDESEEDSDEKDDVIEEHKPKVLCLSPNSQRDLVLFYRDIETIAYDFRNNNAIKAWALKLAENTLRLAGLLQYFSEEDKNEISVEIFDCAIKITKYYARNTINLFLTTFATPEQDSENLYDWLKKRLAINESNERKPPEGNLNKTGLPPVGGPSMFECAGDEEINFNVKNEEEKLNRIKKADLRRDITIASLRDIGRINVALELLVQKGLVCVTRIKNSSNGSVTEWIQLS
ncbi:Uncharacterised protein [Serratia fonticola]|uniref:YfjI family protein n=1 Tax=Serratia fonticola TaxID=47917 RepID=UPI002183578F|nr:YfjI family protein [Serratia fonticola]CAI2160153.1 Uncharacterised protein [Serratia fonticola]